MRILQNQDLKNVVLAVCLRAVGFDCAWVHLRSYNGLGCKKMFSGGPVGRGNLQSASWRLHVIQIVDLANMDTTVERLFTKVARSSCREGSRTALFRAQTQSLD